MLFCLTIVLLNCSMIEPIDLWRNTKYNKQQVELKIYESAQFSNYPSSDKVKFSISAKKEYKVNEPIQIELIWKNTSDKKETIMIRDYWEHPMGTGASIKDANNQELTRHLTNHIFSSRIYTSEELKDFEISLEPNETRTHLVDLLKIPVFKQKGFKNSKYLKKGKYKIQINYYSLESEIVEIEIK